MKTTLDPNNPLCCSLDNHQKDMINVIEPTTPLNNADQGGSFFYSRRNVKLDPEKDKLIMKPPTTFREQVELYKNRGAVSSLRRILKG